MLSWTRARNRGGSAALPGVVVNLERRLAPGSSSRAVPYGSERSTRRCRIDWPSSPPATSGNPRLSKKSGPGLPGIEDDRGEHDSVETACIHRDLRHDALPGLRRVIAGLGPALKDEIGKAVQDQTVSVHLDARQHGLAVADVDVGARVDRGAAPTTAAIPARRRSGSGGRR